MRSFAYLATVAACLLAVGCSGKEPNTDCTPACGEAVCGDDGCGGSCGTCEGGLDCVDGACGGGGTCGNGVLDADETCDDSAGNRCATEGLCTSDDACFVASFSGSPDTCDSVCETTTIAECTSGDGCCPDGCNPGNDVDCAPETCGNGTLDPGESCDPPDFPCESTCEATEACTSATFWGFEAACTLQCMIEPITMCYPEADGCCPAGCTFVNDGDCIEPVCGDGRVDGEEKCDNAIAAGMEGACPADCDDNIACTADITAGSAADCSLYCSRNLLTACTAGDGCCPAGCTSANDADCDAVVCGDGIVDGDEGCDNAIPAGDSGACPMDVSACDDGDPCTTDTLEGVPGDCSARCVNTPPPCQSGDSCCPTACSPNEDAECAALGLCDEYCFDALSYCTGDYELYATSEACQDACADMPIGEPGLEYGNSIECRIIHLESARSDPQGHCEHAAEVPNGGCE